LVGDGDGALIDEDGDPRRDARLLRCVERVVDDLFHDDERPALDRMSGSLHKFGARGELRETRN
jgi:hypothetical protein